MGSEWDSRNDGLLLIMGRVRTIATLKYAAESKIAQNRRKRIHKIYVKIHSTSSPQICVVSSDPFLVNVPIP